MAETRRDVSQLQADDTPVRNYMGGESITWKKGKPNYQLINKKYLAERTRQHKPGSLEKTVENLVKTWEMEVTHKPNVEDWDSIDLETFTFNVNGGPRSSARDLATTGSYNLVMDRCVLYDSCKLSNESSHRLFHTAFPGGFAWELLDILSGPPKVSFTWRHWASWTGRFADKEPTGEQIEMFGVLVATVNDDLKLTDVQVFVDPNPMLVTFLGGKPKCPFAFT